MKKSVKMWIAALRSGAYKQGTQWLRNGNEFCCLGVACDLYNKTHKRGLDIRKEGGEYYFDGSADYLPNKVQKWLGMSTASGEFGSDALVEMNDRGKSFAEIADLIESEPDGLFTEDA